MTANCIPTTAAKKSAFSPVLYAASWTGYIASRLAAATIIILRFLPVTCGIFSHSAATTAGPIPVDPGPSCFEEAAPTRRRTDCRNCICVCGMECHRRAGLPDPPPAVALAPIDTTPCVHNSKKRARIEETHRSENRAKGHGCNFFNGVWYIGISRESM